MADTKSSEPLPSRFGTTPVSDTLPTAEESWPTLPAVDWQSVGCSAAVVEPFSDWDPCAPLPRVDFVVLTWTLAEWAALDHVFCDSQSEMPYDFEDDSRWREKWYYYRRNYDRIEKDLPSRAPSLKESAWGSCCRVRFPDTNKTALLIKSDMHLQSDGKTLPLFTFVKQILDETDPELVLTIGTAGGTRPEDCLGTANIGWAAKFDLSGDFANRKFNNKTFRSDWRPDKEAVDRLHPLLMTTPVTWKGLEALAAKVDGHRLEDLLNATVEPGKLSAGVNLLDNLVLTDNSYGVGTTDGKYAEYLCLEMDDAIIGMAASEKDKDFGIVRNISDPVQNTELDSAAQQIWSSLLYKTYGLYSSFNGAVAAWAALAGKGA